ncbi:MAG: thiamine-phosphate kinase [Planctomycetaceae bacterium]
MTTENDFIRRLARRFPLRPPVEVGIGDDGAVLRCGRGTGHNLTQFETDRIVVVTDMLLDGVHFELDKISPSLAGRKAVAVNLSDLAAMACFPTAAFVSIAVPKAMKTPSGEFLDELYAGIESLTDQFSFTLAGGDTNSWNGPFAINVCLTGTPMRERPVLRSGAKPGDHLFVTGPLGGSLHFGRHLTFEPRLKLAEWLTENANVNAMMDLSDGLSMDLSRMMEASKTGAVIHSESIPIHPEVPSNTSQERRLSSALSDGEDFELLLSLADSGATTIIEKAARSGMTFHKIGRVTADSRIQLLSSDGTSRPMNLAGWQHELP